MFRRFFWTWVLLAFLVACAPLTGAQVASPTSLPETATPLVLLVPSPSPTLGMVPSLTATFTLQPTKTSTATEPVPTATVFPFPDLDFSPTLAATDAPQPKADDSAIQFYGPGPLSKVVPPVTFYGYAVPGYGNKGTVELFGEDGSLLFSQLLQLNTAYKWAYFAWKLPFAIDSVGELGRLTMSVRDQYGRVTAVDSVHLLLLAEGDSIINPSGDLRERCVLEEPVAGRGYSGGWLDVDGMIRPYNGQPLTIELITRDENVIGSQLAAVSPASSDGYVPFNANVAYSISAGTWALLTVSQPDDRIPGTMYLYSREIYLSP